MDINGDEGSDDVAMQSGQLSSHQGRQGVKPLDHTRTDADIKRMEKKVKNKNVGAGYFIKSQEVMEPGVIYIKVGQLKLLQGCKVVMVSLQAGIHVLAPHHLRDG